METLVKVECDDEEEFQCIPVEEVQRLSEIKNLSEEPSLIERNALKRSYTSMIHGTLPIIENVTGGVSLPSEVEQPMLPENTLSLNDSEELDLIYSPPFFKIIQQLGPDKDIYLVRCYSCGRLMRSLAKHPLKIIQHMRSSHPEIAAIYDRNKSVQQITNTNAIDTTNAENSNNCSFVEVNPDCSKADNNLSKTISGIVQNENHGDNFVIEIVDDDENNEHTANKETTSVKNVPTSTNNKSAAGFSAPTSKKLGDIINERLHKIIRETGFVELNNKVNELLKSNAKNDSNSHSIIKELELEVNNLKNECKALRLAVSQTQKSKRLLQNELQRMENHLQQRKLIIKNIEISNREQPIKDVEKLFKDNLKLENIAIVKCFVIPGSKKLDSAKTSAPVESVSVELLHPKDCKLVLRQMQKLKDTGIYIEHELTPMQRKRRNKLMILRKELLSLKPDLKLLVHDSTLVVNGKKFYWDDNEGPYHNEASEMSGVEYLKSITGLDLKEFVSFLLKYEVKAK